MSLGKAAVYKHIPVYYPQHVGSVGGVVGMIGGLGGFVLPIAVRRAQRSHRACGTSCFMLLFALVALSRWSGCTSSIRHMETGVYRRGARASCPSCPRCRRSTSRKHVGALRAACSSRTGGRRTRSSGRRRVARIARRNLWISIPALLLSFAVWMVWSVVVAKLPSVGFTLHDRPAVLARGAAGHIGRDAAHLLLLHGADLRRPAVDHARPPGR